MMYRHTTDLTLVACEHCRANLAPLVLPRTHPARIARTTAGGGYWLAMPRFGVWAACAPAHARMDALAGASWRLAPAVPELQPGTYRHAIGEGWALLFQRALPAVLRSPDPRASGLLRALHLTALLTPVSLADVVLPLALAEELAALCVLGNVDEMLALARIELDRRLVHYAHRTKVFADEASGHVVRPDALAGRGEWP